jgi:LemA protein
MNLLYIILIIFGVIVLFLIFAYNSFVRLSRQTDEAWADVDVQLKRRFDLIPNLIEAVKGYMAHERGVLEKVTEARTMALGAKTVHDKETADNMLTSALKTLFAVAENYPALRAAENFKHLQEELSDTENKIQAARRFYNSNVRDLNIRIEIFPYNLLAGPFGFKKRDFFELEQEEAREPVKVKF